MANATAPTPSDVSLADVWARRRALAWRRVDDECVVLDVQQRMLRGMNLTAWRVWEGLDGTRTLQQLADELTAAFALGTDAAGRDVVDFLQQLRQADLVERVK